MPFLDWLDLSFPPQVLAITPPHFNSRCMCIYCSQLNQCLQFI